MLKIVGVLAALIAAPASAITFNDGLVHVIDADNSFPFEGITVQDGPGGTTTSVIIVAGGLVDGLIRAEGSSEVVMTGGEVHGAFRAEGSSHLEIIEGIITAGVEARDSSVVNIGGGVFGGEFWSGILATDGDAVVTVFGGSFSAPSDQSVLPISGNSVVYIFGGTFTDVNGGAPQVYGNGELNLLNGMLDNVIVTSAGAVFNFFDGSLARGARASDGGTINMSGGIAAGEFRAESDGAIIMWGGDIRGARATGPGSTARISGGTFEWVVHFASSWNCLTKGCRRGYADLC